MTVPVIFQRVSRRTVFIAAVPAYWFLVFSYVLGYFDLSLFTFVVGMSYVISTLFFDNWGVLQWGMSG